VLEDVVLYDVVWPDAQRLHRGEFATVLATDDGGATGPSAAPTEKTIFGQSFAASGSWAVGIDGSSCTRPTVASNGPCSTGTAARDDRRARVQRRAQNRHVLVDVVGKTASSWATPGRSRQHRRRRHQSRRVLPDRERYSWLRDVSLVDGAVGVVVGAKGIRGAIQGGEITLADGGKAVATTE
jgi:hypothetical protein